MAWRSSVTATILAGILAGGLLAFGYYKSVSEGALCHQMATESIGRVIQISGCQ